MIHILSSDTPFPPLEHALVKPNGLLAAGGDLSPERLLSAYRRGIFPWFNDGEPILWWSPDPRMVLFPNELKVSRSLRQTLKKKRYEIRTDHAFSSVIRACAAPRRKQDGTWIHHEMIAAYSELHRQGIAHSVETWINGELAGGLYGVAIGQMFFGESMFSRITDASKIALVHLVKQLENWNFGLIDCQMKTAHLASMGAREIPRSCFVQRLKELIREPGRNGRWHFDYTYLEN
ncbi:leucyl/phenylalanyl-tRNA--protein transferase [Nitrosomonas halophila]|jgi:leucyl/phenylalanyl-tRNA---protein transferase|uniref:Leucyl/phenylalanyl-tRNA--protein transferase n=1 Tax=Nitrosomonas halophila TaxID=44576 RepID=A0A1H3BNS9_9PROT|nr:leucyl/phenylalanyl-tRNA--protein transferase [Nitrosomonas halophila]SDX43563.1 leucyl/phenylalanyl-tRNA--protein transferase [Nitrosomonas halophila]